MSPLVFVSSFNPLVLMSMSMMRSCTCVVRMQPVSAPQQWMLILSSRMILIIWYSSIRRTFPSCCALRTYPFVVFLLSKDSLTQLLTQVYLMVRIVYCLQYQPGRNYEERLVFILITQRSLHFRSEGSVCLGPEMIYNSDCNTAEVPIDILAEFIVGWQAQKRLPGWTIYCCLSSTKWWCITRRILFS